ncbi:carbon catabolite repressor protein 45 [Dorcoceras hygrometricum]|uniref:Carbon catabolite repressor protein 45 n=1 Tax=Dorcoceras hygrometricum TaxID=472368 RepID=A0A2Z7ARG9_9LAMI|nr:carbon catabolite repressor protein 45 [Dorcoceras hygrometricum]
MRAVLLSYVSSSASIIDMMTSRLLPQASSTDMMTSWLLNLDFFRSAMLTSSLLLVATSSRHADVIIAESRFLFASNPSATSSRHADVIIAESRFLFASNPSDFSSLQIHQLISRFLSISNADVIVAAPLDSAPVHIFFLLLSSNRLHRFCSRSHFRMRPGLFPPKRSNEQDSLLCNELLRFWPNSFV